MTSRGFSGRQLVITKFSPNYSAGKIGLLPEASQIAVRFVINSHLAANYYGKGN